MTTAREDLRPPIRWEQLTIYDQITESEKERDANEDEAAGTGPREDPA